MVIASEVGQFLRRAPVVAVWLWVCLAGALPILSAEDSHADQPADASANRTSSSGHRLAPDAQAKKQALSLGFIMLACIIVGGTFLLTLVVIWGNRMRRLARSPLPPVSKRDELWFLKPKKDSDENPEGELKNAADPSTEPERE